MMVQEEALAFIRRFSQLYFEERDFDAVKSMMDPDVFWIGTGKHEICKNFQQAQLFLQAEADAWDGHYKILKDWFEVFVLDPDTVIITGEQLMQEDSRLGDGTILVDMEARLTAVCRRQGGVFKALHVHYSVPNAGQQQDEFVHKALIEGYNLQLEEKLRQRTKLLQERNTELETIYSHVDFGVAMGAIDSMQVLFASDQALRIFGFDRTLLTENPVLFLSDFIHSEEDAQLAYGRELLKKGEVLHQKIRALHSTGKQILIKVTGILLDNWHGEKVGLYTFQDVTEEEFIRESNRKNLEELLISEKRYQIAVAQAGAALYDFIFDKNEMIFPAALAQRHDLPLLLTEAAHHTVWERVIHAGSLPSFYRLHREIQTGVETISDTIIAKDVDGVDVYYDVTLTAIFDENQQPLRAVGVLRDATGINQLKNKRALFKLMTANKQLLVEANITRDKVIDLDKKSHGQNYLSGSFTAFIQDRCRLLIHPEDKAMVLRTFNREVLIQNLEQGNSQANLQYRRKDTVDADVYKWIQNDMVCLQDEITGEVRLLCYTCDITDQREKAERLQEVQHLYNLVVSQSPQVYELNLTKNLCLRGHEKWAQTTGLPAPNQYSAIVQHYAETVVFAEDVAEFLKVFSLRNLLTSFAAGTREFKHTFRAMRRDGENRWICSTMHVFEDVESGDLRAYSYFEDVHEDMLRQLELIYLAEHDQLTNLYNKMKTEQAIQSFLSSEEGKNGHHALFVFDVDKFKDINDTMGHAFGDVVLSRTAAKTQELFRDNDIIGRIGGDEFAVLMKNMHSEKHILNKARDLCEQLRDSYLQKEDQLNISVSVGIAMFPNHASTYSGLYSLADVAMYSAKNAGRNGFRLYQQSMGLAPSKARVTKQIDQNDLLEAKSFEQNVSEYIFRILYESQNKPAAIQSVLGLVGKQYSLNRAYIYENDQLGLHASNTFEWCAYGIEPQKEKLQAFTYAQFGSFQHAFSEKGILYFPDTHMVPECFRNHLKTQSTQSMVLFALNKNETMNGFVGFSFCDLTTSLTKAVMTVLRTVSNMLGVFLNEMRALEAADTLKNVALTIVDALDSYAYIIDADTFELLLVNQKTMKLVPNIQVGDICYRSFWRRDTPCERCPMQQLAPQMGARCTLDMENVILRISTRATATWIRWVDERRVCLMDCVDVTDLRPWHIGTNSFDTN